MKHRFFVPEDNRKEGQIIFPPETARQILQVLRMVEGDEVEVIDNTGCVFQVRLLVSSRLVMGEILSVTKVLTEAQLMVHLYVSLAQREKFEWILQKSTELGVACVIPVISSRSVVQNIAGSGSRQQRWKKILQEASEQSRRAQLPALLPAMTFDEALIDSQQRCAYGILAAPNAERSLAEWMPSTEACALFIGPEGGFSDQEVDSAQRHGLAILHLGKRILRMETAVIAALAILLAKSGDLS